MPYLHLSFSCGKILIKNHTPASAIEISSYYFLPHMICLFYSFRNYFKFIPQEVYLKLECYMYCYFLSRFSIVLVSVSVSILKPFSWEQLLYTWRFFGLWEMRWRLETIATAWKLEVMEENLLGRVRPEV